MVNNRLVEGLISHINEKVNLGIDLLAKLKEIKSNIQHESNIICYHNKLEEVKELSDSNYVVDESKLLSEEEIEERLREFGDLQWKNFYNFIENWVSDFIDIDIEESEEKIKENKRFLSKILGR